jgi:NAD(P)-dependent dehydrogenase (short-subunit alcohol dehydrogenase family)
MTKEQPMQLDGRVAIISGVGPGLGRATALKLTAAGARVVLAARSEQTLGEVAGEVEAAGGTALAVPTDITVEADVGALVARTREEFGRLDALVNNAFLQPPLEPIAEATDDTWRQAFEVNVLGSVRMTRTAVNAMDDGGSVVFVNSMSSRRIQPRFGVYSALKGALLNVAKSFALEHGADGIRVNSVVPGYIWGPNVEAWFEHRAAKRGVEPSEIYAEVAAGTALHHLPTAEEIADAVTFLVSDASVAVTGQAIDVNAGHWFH